LHQVAFQPIVELATGRLHEYECLFRTSMPMLPQSISAIVHSAIDTGRSVELDTFIVRLILARAGEIEAQRQAAGEASIRIAIDFTPETVLAPPFDSAR